MFSRRSISRRDWLRACGASAALQAAPFRRSSGAAGTPRVSACGAFARTPYPPLLRPFIDKLDPASDGFPTEQYVEQIAKVLGKWSEALRRSARDAPFCREDLREELLAASSFRQPGTAALRNAGPLQIERRTFRQEPQLVPRDRFLAGLAEYLASFAAIETAEFEVYGIGVLSESPQRVETEIRSDLVGVTTGGGREQRVGSWKLGWARHNERWMVERWVMNPEVRSRLAGPGFVDVSSSVFDPAAAGVKQLRRGIDSWRTELDGACGIDVYGNHGIACGDIDGSGFDSLYICQPSGLPNRLFRNRGDGTLEDITEVSGTGILDGTASALFADFFNRGSQELLVVRSGGPLLFLNQGNGRFQPQPDAFRFSRPPEGTFTSAAAADYDRNGLLDVYLCVYSYYQGLNQYAFPTPYYDAQNGPPNFLFRNRGDGTFEDVTVASGMDQNNHRFSFAGAWCDYDGDGWPDLYVANDFGRKNLYRSNGRGGFSDVAQEAGVEDYGPGMSVCWLDFDNNGWQDVYVANMWLPEGKRITANEHFLPGAPADIRQLYEKHNAGNSLYKNDGKGAFSSATNEAGTAMARWSWSCAAWDFDHDGSDDLYIANGFISGPNHYDLQSFFWRQVAQRSFTPAGAGTDYELAWNAVNELVRSDYSWSGYERNVFYANNSDGTFSDISGTLGLDLRDDCRAYALTDMDHDGRLEIVLKNRTGPQLRVLQNAMQGLGNCVAFRLRGHKSNRDAIGAAITIEGERRQTKFISAGSGFASQHSKELHFGLGGNPGPLAVSVRWPSGAVERYHDVPVNCRVAIEEGSGHFEVAPFRTRAAHQAEQSVAAANDDMPGSVRTWLLSPVFGPAGKWRDLQGQSRELAAKGAPAVLTFFRVGCVESERQVRELQAGLRSLSTTGLQVSGIALNAEPDSEVVRDFASNHRLTFPILLADSHSAGAWNVFYHFLFDRRRDMPVPLSVLLDRTGAVIRVYQGFASANEMAHDWKNAPASPAERFARALPFAGPYFGNAMLHNYFTDGIAYIEYGYTEEARDAFQRAVDANPAHAAAWFNLGTIYLGKKMFAEARKCFNESIRLNPQDADAWNNLGLVAGESGDYNEALEAFEKAARANPNHALAVENMMRIFQYLGRPADARKMLEELIPKAPANAGLHLAYGMTLVAQNQLPSALSELQTAVRLAPENADALNDLGALLVRLGRKEEAMKCFDRCRLAAPDFDRPVLNIANLYSQAGQAAKARQVLEDFSARHPEDADVQNALQKLPAN